MNHSIHLLFLLHLTQFYLLSIIQGQQPPHHPLFCLSKSVWSAHSINLFICCEMLWIVVLMSLWRSRTSLQAKSEMPGTSAMNLSCSSTLNKNHNSFFEYWTIFNRNKILMYNMLKSYIINLIRFRSKTLLPKLTFRFFKRWAQKLSSN